MRSVQDLVRGRVRFSALLILGLAAACGDSTAPKAPAITVDTLFADITESQELATAGLSLGGGIVPMAKFTNSASCIFNATSKLFVCPPVTEQGLTFTSSYQLLDGSNQPQSAFNAATTAAIRTISDITGTVASPSGAPTGSASITGHQEHTLSGLLTENHVLNGTGAAAVTLTAPTSFTLNSTQTITNLKLPKRGSDGFPESGSIAMTATSSELGLAATVTMTFNGTSTVTMVINSGGITQTCTIDLKNPQAVPSCT